MMRRPNRHCDEARVLAGSHTKQNVFLATLSRLIERVANVPHRVDCLSTNIENDVSRRQSFVGGLPLGVNRGDNDPFVTGALDRASWSETEIKPGLLAILRRSRRLKRGAW